MISSNKKRIGFTISRGDCLTTQDNTLVKSVSSPDRIFHLHLGYNGPMDRLWAPWRMQYVTGSDDKKAGNEIPHRTGCIFCDKPQEDRDAENLIVEKGPTCFVILNAFPYNNGHLMVVPYRHVDHPGLLTPEEQGEM